ncbi:MAG: Gldg family protein [Lachnospiraceae bacterium]|nr:Gldg family protein [Lachnospiraceae bacterium]
MNAIAKRDFQSYMHTFIGWLFIGVLWAFWSFFVANYNFIGLNSGIASTLTASEIIFLILMPILCMRSFSDEQRTKTDQMLFTAPVSVGKIVLGKFFALVRVYSIPVILMCLYPLILSRFGTVSFVQSYVAILGVWLYGLACIAVCVFASSLTENPIIAAVLGFAFLFLGYLVPSIQNMVSNSTVSKVLGAFDICGRFEDFLQGTFDLSAMIYLIVVIFLFLFLTAQVLQKRRFVFSKKTFSLGAYSSTMIIVAIAAAVIVNFAAAQLPTSLKSVDLTTNGIYSLTDDTKNMLTDLDKDVTIYVLASEDDADNTIKHLVENYAAASDHISVQYIDPVSNPTFIQKYTTDTSNLYMNSLVVECGDRYKIVNSSDMYETSVDYNTYQQKTTGFDGEGQVTSAIDYVTRDNLPKIYTLTGHGETTLSTTFSDALSKLNIDSTDLDLMQNDTVPDDAQAVIIYGPTSDLSDDDLQKLEDYCNNGGNLIAVINYEGGADLTNYNKLLADFGISTSSDIVLDSDSSRYYQYPFYLLPNVQSDDITSQVDNGYIMSPFSTPLVTDDSNKDITYTPLLVTSENSYTRGNVESQSDLQPSDSDTMQAYNVGVKAVRSDDNGGGTAIVYSSNYIFNDNANQMVSGSNLNLFNGTVSALVNTDSSISIPVKEYADASLTIATSTGVTLTIFFDILLPIVILASGLVIWLRRRKK